MKRLVLFALAWLVLGTAGAAGCADDPPQSDDDDGSGSGNGVTIGAGGSGQGGAGSGSGAGSSSSSSGAGGSMVTIPICQPACTTVADCNMGVAYLDEDNYSCEQGACVYTGCNSDVECQSAGNYVCYQPAIGTAYCSPACGTPSDCDVGGGVAYDADNYICDQGACVYSGCNSDGECASLGNYICRDLAGTAVCQVPCSSASDCVLGSGPAYDEDNYACVDNLCQYTGCNSDGECMSLGSYVCR